MSNANVSEMGRTDINDEIAAICDAEVFDELRYQALVAEQSRRFAILKAWIEELSDAGRRPTTEEMQAAAGGAY